MFPKNLIGMLEKMALYGNCKVKSCSSSSLIQAKRSRGRLGKSIKSTLEDKGVKSDHLAA